MARKMTRFPRRSGKRSSKLEGLFKERVRRFEDACRITKVSNQTHLIASHCKPWRDSDDEERLDGENGLLLTPSMDHLFDRGFISFEERRPHDLSRRRRAKFAANGCAY
jgi:HNH endonuclease